MSRDRESQPLELPILPDIPFSKYNFRHTITKELPFRAGIVLWNVRDFAHVNWIHRSSYRYCKVLASSPRITLLEYGVRMLFFIGIPLSFATLMYHEYVPPFRVRHLSRSPLGSYTKVEMTVEEFEKNGITYSKYEHAYYASLPSWLMPFKPFFDRYIEKWSERLWKEDMAMMERRHRVLDAGFRDHPLDIVPASPEGFAYPRQ